MFCITIKGVPDKDACDNFWQDIKKYGVNFTVLEKHCYIYGEASEFMVDALANKAKSFGLEISVDRG